MKKIYAAGLATLALAFGACGDDEPEVTTDETVDEEVVDDTAEGATGEPAVGFAALDVDSDGELDGDEMAGWIDDAGIFASWDADESAEVDADEIAANVFSLWDADGDDAVAEAEWEAGTDLWYADAADAEDYTDWDNDGDADLDIDEFTARFDTAALGDAWTDDSLSGERFTAAYFALYDEDGDGGVTEEEWSSGAARLGVAP